MAQDNLHPTSAMTAFVDAKNLDQHPFPWWHFVPLHGPLLAALPDVIAAGWHTQHLSKPPHKVVTTLGSYKAITAHGVLIYEKMVIVFSKHPGSVSAAG